MLRTCVVTLTHGLSFWVKSCSRLGTGLTTGIETLRSCCENVAGTYGAALAALGSWMSSQCKLEKVASWVYIGADLRSLEA